jgi:predicted metal-binding membrane protein
MTTTSPYQRVGTTRGGTDKRAYLAATLTLVLAGACWAVTVRQMAGMNMGAASRLGSFSFFVVLWTSMMGAMMLPGVVPAISRRAQAGGTLRAVPRHLAAYLAVWTLVGCVVFALYRPHGPVAAGIVVIAAGLYEASPFKSYFRRRGHDMDRSGFQFGFCCVGSSIGLMLVLVAVDVMSVAWMAVVAALAVAQKLVPARLAIDVPVALAIVGLGVLIVVHPSSIPGLLPPM